MADSGAVRVAMDGALKHTDSLGFLHHPNEDTWMDAVAPAGVVTPRGSRAVEIQALHATSLDLADRMAAAWPGTVPHDTRIRWRETREKLHRNFLTSFLAPSKSRLWDRLIQEDRPDTSTRPNQLFALTVPYSPLVPPVIQSEVVKYVAQELVQPFGVLSLSPRDTAFHPHHMDPNYPKDDAYHQGIVWVWLSGPAKTALRMEGRTELAIDIADYEARLMHERGLVGSLPELLDAKVRAGNSEPNYSGTTTQAWSLSEFLRTTYQDILGIRPVFVRGKSEPFWLFDPRIPEEWGKVEARIMLEQTPLFVTMQNHGDSLTITILAEQKPTQSIGLKIFDERQGITGFLNAAEPLHFTYIHKDSLCLSEHIPTSQVSLSGWPYDSGNQDIRFAEPITHENFKSLEPPDWELLSAEDALAASGEADVLWSKSDPALDDTGYGGFLYPTNEYYLPGILDLTNFEIRADQDRYYFELKFRDLVQPGWHPEYGFQLTYAALCLHTAEGKRTSLENNSGYEFDSEDDFSRVILVGGGFRVEDDSGTILAQFTPRDENHAFGDTVANQVSFSLPKHLFPSLTPDWRWTVLVGAQDDHGGAGMGEFRTVKPTAELWAGGGNPDSKPNIYDTLILPKRSQ
jgi:hypothetical protein